MFKLNGKKTERRAESLPEEHRSDPGVSLAMSTLASISERPSRASLSFNFDSSRFFIKKYK